MTPSRKRRATKHHSATMRLKAAARWTARSGSPMASGAMAVPAISATVDSGPTDSMRDLPMTAYTMRAGSVVQSPTTGGTPTMAQ